MQQQKIGADSVFAIYGAATTGAIIYRNLVQQGLQVGCFIDRRYAEIDSYFDVPVLSVEEFAQKFDKNTTYILYYEHKVKIQQNEYINGGNLC